MHVGTHQRPLGAVERRQRRLVILPRHLHQLRVPHLLALLPGRRRRSRGAHELGSWSRPVSAEGEQPAYGTVVDEAPCAVLATLHESRGSTCDSRRRASASVHVTSPRRSRGQPYMQERYTAHEATRGIQDYNWHTQRLEGRERPRPAISWAPGALQASPAPSPMFNPQSPVVGRAQVIGHRGIVAVGTRRSSQPWRRVRSSRAEVRVDQTNSRSKIPTSWYVFGIRRIITQPEEWPIRWTSCDSGSTIRFLDQQS